MEQLLVPHKIRFFDLRCLSVPIHWSEATQAFTIPLH